MQILLALYLLSSGFPEGPEKKSPESPEKKITPPNKYKKVAISCFDNITSQNVKCL